MTCSSIDLKALVLGELPKDEVRPAEEHVAGCEPCRLEVERLRLTGAALMALADEEIPRRIAFVSDKVFEPRWWQRAWRSGPALGFASAAMLSGAILVHGFTRPAPVVTMAQPAAVAAVVDNGAIERAVASAVTASEARQKKVTATMLAAAEQRYQEQRQADVLAVSANLDVVRKQMNRVYVASNQ